MERDIFAQGNAFRGFERALVDRRGLAGVARGAEAEFVRGVGVLTRTLAAMAGVCAPDVLPGHFVLSDCSGNTETSRREQSRTGVARADFAKYSGFGGVRHPAT